MKTWMIASLAALSLTAYAPAEPPALTVPTDQTTKTVGTGIFGQLLEHIFNSLHGALWGDQILNGTLEVRPPTTTSRPATGPQSVPATDPANPALPRHWEFLGAPDEVTIDPEEPFNGDVSISLVGKTPASAPGILQRHIALQQGEKYTLTLYARGMGGLLVAFKDQDATLFSKDLMVVSPEWDKSTLEFTAPRTVLDASLVITAPNVGTVNLDQISLCSATSLAHGGYRPNLLKALVNFDLSRWFPAPPKSP
jgi:hypothetical protein